MRSDVVVPSAEFDQLRRQIDTVEEDDSVEPLLEDAEEPFDATILPGAVQLNGAEPNAE